MKKYGLILIALLFYGCNPLGLLLMDNTISKKAMWEDIERCAAEEAKLKKYIGYTREEIKAVFGEPDKKVSYAKYGWGKSGSWFYYQDRKKKKVNVYIFDFGRDGRINRVTVF